MKQMIAAGTLVALALTACQQEDPNNIAIDEGNTQGAEIETLPPDESSMNNMLSSQDSDTNAGMPVPPDPVTAATIPAQYHGRWGMVPADCTSTRGDAKGLITIADKTVRFYEAVATLKEKREAPATSWSGLFGFTGEGQTWEKVQTLTRTGNVLKRAENDGTFTYTRCA